MKVAVVGGGIAGLAATWELALGGCQVDVFEPGHLGGKIRTSEFLGHLVDEGPDSLLARVPEGVGLCRELGLGSELVAPAASKAMVWSGGHLRPLPEGLVLGAPARLVPLARSRVISAAGMARALCDLVLPRTAVADDESVFDLVAKRFGAEVATKLVDPLVGSIYAGSTKGLSAATVAPQLLQAARAGRSLWLSLRKAAPPARRLQHRGTGQPEPPAPVFLAPRAGMQAIVDRLVERLSRPEMCTRFSPTEVSEVVADRDGVVVAPGDERYDGAVVAVPAPAALRVLGPVLAGASDEGTGAMAATRFASVGIVTLAFADGELRIPAGVSGVLVAPGGELLMTACSFASNKWPHWSSPGTDVLRVSVGKAGDERWAPLPDEALVGRLLDELATVLGRGKAAAPLPGGWRVSRWPAALPQYRVGHLRAMAALRSLLAERAPTVALAGASYGRVGVPACTASGREAGARVLRSITSSREPAA